VPGARRVERNYGSQTVVNFCFFFTL
jgi:hypothetical protein